jgi:hypothetical protein
VTGFEFHLIMKTIKKINHLRMQIAAKRSKIYANLQPAATRDLTSKEFDGSWVVAERQVFLP